MMNSLKRLVCLIIAIVCVLSAISCGASAEKQVHKHSYIAISDESYFVTLQMDGERVTWIDFYIAYDYVKTFSVDLKYNLWGRVRSAVTYQYYSDETIKGTDCTVKYDKNGSLTELTVFESEYRVFSVEYSKNENGDTGYYLRYDGSASFFELNEDGLAKTMLYHIGDEYLTLFATYIYDEKGRLTEISADVGKDPITATFAYEDDSCCFSEMINSAEDGYRFAFERDEDHNAAKCEFVSKHRSFLTEFKYESERQTIVSTTQDYGDE